MNVWIFWKINVCLLNEQIKLNRDRIEFRITVGFRIRLCYND